MTFRRRTLQRPTRRIEGIGLHTGAPSWVRLLPSEGPLGDAAEIVFRNSAGQTAEATVDRVVDTRRCTVLDIGGTRISTVEHLMSALSGLGVTDVVVEFDGPEMPIADGSAKQFVDEIVSAGVIDMGAEIRPLVVTGEMSAGDGKGSRIFAFPSDRFSVTVLIDYPDRARIGTQAAAYCSADDYGAEVAPARTYGFLSEFEQLLALGLATGASLDNCVALLDDGSPDPRTPMRFHNEPARHKLLDVIGDLGLAGRPLQARVVALRPSHAVNCALARELALI